VHGSLIIRGVPDSSSQYVASSSLVRPDSSLQDRLNRAFLLQSMARARVARVPPRPIRCVEKVTWRVPSDTRRRLFPPALSTKGETTAANDHVTQLLPARRCRPASPPARLGPDESPRSAPSAKIPPLGCCPKRLARHVSVRWAPDGPSKEPVFRMSRKQSNPPGDPKIPCVPDWPARRKSCDPSPAKRDKNAKRHALPMSEIGFGAGNAGIFRPPRAERQPTVRPTRRSEPNRHNT